MKITVLTHNLSSNAAMRAYRIAEAARKFADVTLAGPVEESRGPWPALPSEPWIISVAERRFPKFTKSFLKLVDAADGDVLVAVKPHLASFGVALVAAERRGVPLMLDMDDLDVELVPREEWDANPEMFDLRRPASAVYVSLLTRATGAASAITVSSTALQHRFGGTLLPHGSSTELFNPAAVDRVGARDEFGFSGPTVLFPGTPRAHKGLETVARAVARIPGARLAVTCRPDKDLTEPEWRDFPLIRIPLVPYGSMPRLLAAADVVAIPQSDTRAARYQMPMKAYDAMAMGRPIVASSVSDLPLVLQGCARIVAPDDDDALAAAISELLGDPDTARLGQRARARALQNYSTERIAETLQAIVAGLATPEARDPVERREVSS